jgi:hypothetical protein
MIRRHTGQKFGQHRHCQFIDSALRSLPSGFPFREKRLLLAGFKNRISMQIDTSKWTREDYLAFVLYYMAGADVNIEPHELDVIAEHCGSAHLDTIRGLANQCNDFQCIELISQLRPQFFPGDAGKEELSRDMVELCQADGRFTHFEEAVLHSLRKIL